MGVLEFSFLSTTQRKGTGARLHHVNCAENFLNYIVWILGRIIVGAMHSSIELVKEFLPGGRFFVQKLFALYSAENFEDNSGRKVQANVFKATGGV